MEFLNCSNAVFIHPWTGFSQTPMCEHARRSGQWGTCLEKHPPTLTLPFETLCITKAAVSQGSDSRVSLGPFVITNCPVLLSHLSTRSEFVNIFAIHSGTLEEQLLGAVAL